MEKSCGFTLFGLGRDPLKDPERFDSFGEAWWGGLYPHESPGGKEALLFPMDSRTTASPTGADKYVFYGPGGLSWSVPWAAGLYALACQVKPDVTPELFWKTALETGDIVPLPAKWPNPTPEEIDARARKTLEARMDAIKNRAKGKDFDQYLGEIYGEATSQAKDRMSEADFRAWFEVKIKEGALRETKPRSLKKSLTPPASLRPWARRRAEDGPGVKPGIRGKSAPPDTLAALLQKDNGQGRPFFQNLDVAADQSEPLGFDHDDLFGPGSAP